MVAELGQNEATRTAMIDAARAFLMLADDVNEEVSAYIDGSNKPEAKAAYTAVKEAEAEFLNYYAAYWGEPRRRPQLQTRMETLPIHQPATMTSLQIAEIAGKQHRHLLDSIRKMEIAWEKVTGSSFRLSEYTDTTGRTLPCYELTKDECLYIATKFNDEARALLIMAWAELEAQPKRNNGQVAGINEDALKYWRWNDLKNIRKIFIYLLSNAQINDGFSHGKEIKQGQIITTEKIISLSTGLKRGSI